ncbi:ArsR/SmtB family transcription factor [Haloarchaeobius amylolyticus]|uniref:ArsR/SmtB family transcription factor n=1 Tax=Haloarchaeobius amylolyticus TaxID=1198296 RepID=UPI00226DA4F8|nr:helix-turn-helix domain-containing protein [Haloarchaeobius amylolyticus]
MSRLLPFRSDDAPTPGEQAPRVVELEGDDADKVFGALSSDTARQIYTCLHEEPRTPSDVADEIDSSIQNVRYHLEKLEDAGLIDVVDVWYSSRGNEMNVYAPQSGPLVISGDEQRASRLKGALARFIGGIGVVAAGSLFVQYGLPRLLGGIPSPTSGSGAGGTDGGEAAGGADVTYQNASGTEKATETAADSGGDGGGVSVQEVTETTTETAEGTSTAQPMTTEAATQTETAAPTETAAAYDTTTATESPQLVTDGGAEATTTAADAATSGADAALSSIPPGAAFFAGGLLVLTLVVAIWYVRDGQL